MKDYPYWHDAIKSAKSYDALKNVGENLAVFQNQPDLIGGEPMLSEHQVDSLRMIYSLKIKKFQAEKL